MTHTTAGAAFATEKFADDFARRSDDGSGQVVLVEQSGQSLMVDGAQVFVAGEQHVAILRACRRAASGINSIS